MTPPRRAFSVGPQYHHTPSTAPTPPSRDNLRRHQSAPLPALAEDSIRHHVTFTERRFDVQTLPPDLLRVYTQLAQKYGDDYALTFVFIVRTAIELHRAWHMTLLTSKILQQVKDRFGIRMTWNLGVVKLIFRVEDGGFELHRKVPYDYDSEYQDLYMKIAVALVEGHITLHEALIFQSETKQGLHTAPSGLFLRDTPGRLVLYPLEAATCAVIFFGGDWMDAAVAAICGLATGLTEYGCNAWANYSGSKDATILIDVLAGMVTGMIGGLFHQFYTQEKFCLASIFLGTLYWFFYGTAFVIGLLEIIAGELETGVTRFIAVSVKTFVLTLGSAIGLMIVVETGGAYEAWNNQFDRDTCGTIDLHQQWWRIPLYLLCSASALGQYRFPICNYWRGLIVQLVGYEVQYQCFVYFQGFHQRDFLDTAASNIAGAAAAVAAASLLSYIIDEIGYYYNARLLQRNLPDSKIGGFFYNITACSIRFVNMLGIGKKSSLQVLQMQQRLHDNARELRDPNHPRQEIRLEPEEEVALVEAIVEAEDLNIWSLLMPAVYQLVPGSLIAKLWYNAVFPPPLMKREGLIDIGNNTTAKYIDLHVNPVTDDVFYGLWVVSTSLALGLIIGFAIVQIFGILWRCVIMRGRRSKLGTEEERAEFDRRERMRNRQQGVMHLNQDDLLDDPDGGNGDGATTDTTSPKKDVVEEKNVVLPVVAGDQSGLTEPTSSAMTSTPLRQLRLGVLLEEEKKTDVGAATNSATPTIVKLQLGQMDGGGETKNGNV